MEARTDFIDELVPPPLPAAAAAATSPTVPAVPKKCRKRIRPTKISEISKPTLMKKKNKKITPPRVSKTLTLTEKIEILKCIIDELVSDNRWKSYLNPIN